MSTVELPASVGKMEPPASEFTAPFWDATKEKKYLLQWCTVCKKPIFYPRESCPTCMGQDFEWKQATGKGTVYAAVVEYRSNEPYTVALIDLEEGVRVMTNVVGCPPEDVKVGQAVEVYWSPMSDGRHLPLFAPRAT